MSAAWQTLKLAEVCEFKPAKKQVKEKLDDADLVSFAPMGDLGELRMQFEASEERPLSEVYGGYTYFADGDVLCAKITPCFENGKMGVAAGLKNGVGFGSSEYVVMRPSPRILAEYLFYFMLRDEFREAGARVMTGAVGHKRVPKEYFEDHAIPLPPLEEQKRIVAVLDQGFAALDRARALAEANLADAEELFENYIAEAFSNLSKQADVRLLSEICKVERGSSPRPIKNYITSERDGVNWVKIGDIREGQKYVTQTAQKITRKGAEKSRYVEPGDFILTNSMSYGRPYIMKIDGYIHDGWFVLRLGDEVDGNYLYYLISSGFVQAQFAKLAAGSVVKNISSDLVKKALLPIPPLELQRNFADKFAECSEKVEEAAQHYRSKLADLDDLRQSLLQKAFAGDLN